MKIDLYVLRKARILKVSKPGEWMTAECLSEIYNRTYSIGLVTKYMQKTVMHPLRMKRVLQKMIVEGYYEFDSSKGYRFVTKTPKKS